MTSFDPATMNVMTLLDRVKAVDPLGLDEFFSGSSPIVEHGPAFLVEKLSDVVRRIESNGPNEPVAALAALRDLDFLLCAVHLADPFAYKRVAGLEHLLQRLGRIAGHSPRGSNITYALCNPLDDRMRLFTGLPEERMFVHELAIGLRGLDGVLRGLSELADRRVDSPAAVLAARTLEPAWEPMIGATVAMLRRMPPQVFSGKIVTCFLPLDIAGSEYQGVTGAQNLNIGIDYLLWGVDSTDDAYLRYARQNLDEQLPMHRKLIAQTLGRTGDVSLLAHVERQLASGELVDHGAVSEVLQNLESLLRRIAAFRAAHRRLAILNLPLRASPTGSGGHTVDLLNNLAAATMRARRRVRTLRNEWKRAETSPDSPTMSAGKHTCAGS